jgi:type I restriction-modification system DNA methylase subunit
MIPQTFDEAFERIKQLVQVFKTNEKKYLSSDYNELQARQDFIDKFLVALGWDVYHENQTNPYEQEVKVERGVTMSAGRKRADYAFLAPNYRDVLFYVEAKKPQANVDTAANYFQTIRYGWNSRTPLAVLTDFEHFRVLDCRFKPDVETALQRAVSKFHYSEYADPKRFSEIYYLFSREAVRNGSLEKFAESLPKPTGKAKQRTLFGGGYKSIDDSFLQDLDGYRAELAQAFARENPQLEDYELTEITQRTLDRLVFMRFLEDKLIEPEPLVENLGSKVSAWGDFVSTSQRLDAVYNGIIFKKHALLDSAQFNVDENVFEGICESLAHTNSPYDFNAIPIHILGSIYERFLGKVIAITDEGAEVQDKPEVRHANGVFYTPEYIVRYIVDNTVGELIKGKSPEEIRQMKFADVACGSGSFLLGVYETLLRYHTNYYNANKTNRAKGRKAGCIEWEDGTLHLSLLQRRDILLNNIYGADIDPQAVEVAQLSLYLKLLEDETIATSQKYQMEFREALLPSLNSNIICGNSLVGWDVLEGHLFEPEEERKMNPMEFENAFPQVMRRGGFDAIVGNPPYIRIQVLQEWMPLAADYFKRKYSTAETGNYDIYVVFVERGLSLLNDNGRLGFIIPQKFCQVQFGESLRADLSSGNHVKKIVSFTNNQVFDAAFVNTCILILSKAAMPSFEYVEIPKAEKSMSLSIALAFADESTLPSRMLTNAPWVLKPAHVMRLLEKMAQNGEPLEDCTTRIFQGLKTSADKIYVLEFIRETDSTYIARSIQLGREVELEKDLFHPLIKGTEMRRFVPLPALRIILFPYVEVGASVRLMPESRLRSNYPKTYAYLKANETYLRNRENGRMNHAGWYGYGRTQALDVMPLPKLITPDLAPRSSFVVDDTGEIFILGGAAGGYGILPEEGINPLYLAGILNSRAISFFITSSGQQMESGYYSFEARFIRSAPIRTINFSDRKEVAQHDRMVQLVEQIRTAKQQLASAHTDRDRNFYERKCADLDRQIDKLVYELYGLTDEEVAIIEAD